MDAEVPMLEDQHIGIPSLAQRPPSVLRGPLRPLR